jgi:hypothetical protein
VDLGVAKQYFDLFDNLPFNSPDYGHWESRVNGTPAADSAFREKYLGKGKKLPDLVELPSHGYRMVGGTVQKFSIAEQNKFFVDLCRKYDCMFADKVKIEPTISEIDTDPVPEDDENKLVIVISKEDPTDVELRWKKDLVECIDLTEEEGSGGLVYHATCPTHYSQEGQTDEDAEEEDPLMVIVPDEAAEEGMMPIGEARSGEPFSSSTGK